MSKAWPKVRLGEVLRRSEETIQVQPDISYRQITVKLWGKGVVLRGVLTGAEIAASRQMVARRGQFILSRIDARNGALGIVPDELDEAIVSNDFPVFDVAAERLLPAYLGWMCKTESFVEECKRASEGTTNRVRLQEKNFLGREIPLPPLAEQQRIVVRIEELALQIREAKNLSRAAIDESEALFEVTVNERFSEIRDKPIERLDALTTKIGSGSTPPGGRSAYPTSGIPFIRSLNVRMRRFQRENLAYVSPETHVRMRGTHVYPGDVLLNITGASIGRVACAPDDIAVANVNQHVSIIRPRADLEARYLMYWLSQTDIQDLINDEQKGATRQGFTKVQIASLKIPMIPLDEQRRIVAELDTLQGEVDALKRLQAETAAELDALLPAILDHAFKGRL